MSHNLTPEQAEARGDLMAHMLKKPRRDDVDDFEAWHDRKVVLEAALNKAMNGASAPQPLPPDVPREPKLDRVKPGRKANPEARLNTMLEKIAEAEQDFPKRVPQMRAEARSFAKKQGLYVPTWPDLPRAGKASTIAIPRPEASAVRTLPVKTLETPMRNDDFSPEETLDNLVAHAQNQAAMAERASGPDRKLARRRASFAISQAKKLAKSHGLDLTGLPVLSDARKKTKAEGRPPTITRAHKAQNAPPQQLPDVHETRRLMEVGKACVGKDFSRHKAELTKLFLAADEADARLRLHWAGEFARIAALMEGFARSLAAGTREAIA